MSADADRPPRPELPTDAWSLEPMGPDFEAGIKAGLAELGLSGEAAGRDAALRSYEAHARLLRDWNRAINLTSVREPAAIARRHVCDSLAAVPHLAGLFGRGTSLLDLGSGGGYPGLPLAASLPLSRVGLLDSVLKKARFLAVAGAAVSDVLAEERPDEAPAIEVIGERAEDIAEEPDDREAWHIVTARAVGSLAEVLELGLPLARPGGAVVAWKRDEAGSLTGELREAGSIIRAAGGGRPKVLDVATSDSPGHRLVIVAKERPTPAAYPRPAGVRRRRKR